ncbi:MAG: sarcosine oxidase subunit gamma family protein [Caldimonas sp.]
MAETVAAAGAPLTRTEQPWHPRWLVRVYASAEPIPPPWHALVGAAAATTQLPSVAVEARVASRAADRGALGVALALGPDVWLLLPAATTSVPARPAGSDEAAVIDVASARIVVRVAGSHALDLLMTGCGVDLHPLRFGVDDFAQTRLGPFAVLIHRVAETAYDVHVDRSLLESFNAWFDASAKSLDITMERA